MIFQLGDIKFEIKNGPTGLRFEESVNFAKQDRLSGKPVLQKVGGVLQSISIDLILHSNLVDVRESIQTLRAAMYEAEEMDFSDGSGYSYGNFVIEKISKEIIKTDEKGIPIFATISIDLLESVSDEEVNPVDVAASRAGFASVSANPIEVKAVPVFSTPASMVMRDVVAGKSSAAAASEKIKAAVKVPALAKKYIAEGARNIERAKTSLSSARGAVDTVQNNISNATALKASLDSVISDLTNLSSNYSVENISSLNNIVRGMDVNLNTLMSTATQLTAFTAIRK